jgi:gluconate 2-dehydrogenase gamma chain
LVQFDDRSQRNDRMSTPSRFNRRDFMKVAAPAAIAVTQGISPAQSSEPADAQQKYLPVFFSDAEWAFVNAAVDRLIPADAHGPGGVEAGVPIFIDRQLDMPYGHGAYFYMQGPFHPDAHPSLGYQLQYTPRELYRLGIAAADSACKQAHGHVFADLPHPEQEQFLTSLEKGAVTLQGPPAAALFEQL